MVTMLDRFNASLAHTNYEKDAIVVGGIYRVFFTGLVATQDRSILIGNWMGWPYHPENPSVINRTVDLNRTPLLVHSVHGRASGAYEAGASWDIRPPEGEPPITIMDLDTVAGRNRATVLIGIGRVRILQMAKDVCEGVPVPMIRSIKLVPTDAATGEVIYD